MLALQVATGAAGNSSSWRMDDACFRCCTARAVHNALCTKAVRTAVGYCARSGTGRSRWKILLTSQSLSCRLFGADWYTRSCAAMLTRTPSPAGLQHVQNCQPVAANRSGLHFTTFAMLLWSYGSQDLEWHALAARTAEPFSRAGRSRPGQPPSHCVPDLRARQ